MKQDNGFNPLRWKCDVRGCFNEKQRPKIEIFCGCFPGRINFSDVDGIVEIAGNGLLLEWKCAPMEIPVGQRIMYERLTRGGLLSVMCVAGDAETMRVTHRGVFYDGKWRGWEKYSQDDLKTSMAKWAAWAKEHPRFGGAK